MDRRRIQFLPLVLTVTAALLWSAQPAGARMMIACQWLRPCPLMAAKAAIAEPPPVADEHACCATATPRPQVEDAGCAHIALPPGMPVPDCCLVRPSPTSATPLPAVQVEVSLPLLAVASGVVVILPTPPSLHREVPHSIAPPWLLDASHDRGARGPPSLG
jgi:hypothetical protein